MALLVNYSTFSETLIRRSLDEDESSEENSLLAHHRPKQSSTSLPGSAKRRRPPNGREPANEYEPLKPPSTKKLIAILSTVYLGVVITAVDGTIFATLAAPISAQFGSETLVAWVASSYFVANAAIQPLCGRITDIVGRRLGLLLSNATFALGVLICGLANGEFAVITGRFIAGAGVGGITAIATFVATDVVPLRQRGVVHGFANACFALGGVLGAVLGGWMSDSKGWRFAFLIQLPFVAASIILVLVFIRIPPRPTEMDRMSRVDFVGAILLFLSLVLFLSAMNSGGNIVPWNAPLVLATLPISAVLFVAFVVVEFRFAAEPIIPFRLLSNRTAAAACIANWFGQMAWLAALFYIPVYCQLHGDSAAESGLSLVPTSIGAAAGSIGAGVSMKMTGHYYRANVVMQIALVLSFGLMCTLTLASPGWPLYLYLTVGGIGLGGVLTITLIALVASVDHSQHAIVTSTYFAIRSVGGAVGIAAAFSLYQNELPKQLTKHFGGSEHRQLIDEIRKGYSGPDSFKLPRGWEVGVQSSYNSALRAVFVLTLSTVLFGGIASLCMKEHTLYVTLSRKRH